jgi:hypothetical protein
VLRTLQVTHALQNGMLLEREWLLRILLMDDV